MYIENNIDIIDKYTIIQPLYTIPNFPIYMGCIDNDKYKEDILLDLDFGISKNTGIIQICKYPNDEMIYMFGSHNNAYGKIWNELFDIILDEINEIKNYTGNNIKNIYEIGGGNGKLYNKIKNNLSYDKYIIYEPNIELFNFSDKNLEIKQKYFDDNDILYDADIILHSHVLEHITDPYNFLRNIKKNMSDNTYHIFAVPNLLVQFQKKHTNCLMFEHKNFITDIFIDWMLNDNDMEIINKKYFNEHSIIYIVKKNTNLTKYKIPNMYNVYNEILHDFFDHYTKYIYDINNIIDNKNKEVYIFGAHIFTQFLIAFGLHLDNIKCILDNDEYKINKRLYGTNLYVNHPGTIKGKNCIVILNVGSYKNEILEQLQQINQNIEII